MDAAVGAGKWDLGVGLAIALIAFTLGLLAVEVWGWLSLPGLGLSLGALFIAVSFLGRRRAGFRDELISVTAHELRGPVSALSLRLETARRAARALDSAEADELVAKLHASARQVHRLQRLIDGMQDVSRFAQRRLELQLAEVDLAQIALECSGDEELVAAGCPVSCAVSEPIVGCWDRRRLARIITHLLMTASKYCRDAPLELAATADDDVALISITASGIAYTVEPKNSIRANFNLFVARELVAAHDGSTEIRTDGPRTTFTVRLPRGKDCWEA